MSDAHLEQLEIKLAFLEKSTNDLSDVVYRQQQDIDSLTEQLAALAARVDSLKSTEQPYTMEEERPPHY